MTHMLTADVMKITPSLIKGSTAYTKEWIEITADAAVRNNTSTGNLRCSFCHGPITVHQNKNGVPNHFEHGPRTRDAYTCKAGHRNKSGTHAMSLFARE